MIGSGGHGGGQGSDGQGGYAISATGGSSGGPAGTGGATVPDLDAQITGTRQTWNRYSFIVPAEMDGTEDAPNYLMTAKNSASQGLCALLFMPPRTAETDQATQALTLMSLFADSLELSVSTQNDPRSFYRRGVSAGGWDYVFLTGDLVEKGTGYTTDVQTEITLVNLGAEVAPIVGIQLRNNPCLHNSLFNDHYMPWATLYHSLEFQGFVPATSDRLAKKLLGGWQHKDGSFFTSYVFAANGRYSTFSAFDQYTSISLTEILVTTTAYSGDGAFQVKGNGVFLFPDGKPARAALFRIEESGPLSSSGAWLAQYYELRSAGGLYEFAYTQ